MNQKYTQTAGPGEEVPIVDLRPLRHALSSGNDLGVRRALMGIADLDSPDPETGDSPLHLLSHAGHTGGLEVALRRGAYTEVQDRAWRTPLHCAAIADKAEAVRLLHAAGADIEAVARDGRRPVHQAVFYRAKAALRALLDARACVHTPAATGDTPLHLAVTAAGADTEIAEMLLAAGRSIITARDCNHDTALHLACEYRNVDLTRLLLRNYAPASVYNRLDLTPDLMPSAVPGKDNLECRNYIAQARWNRQAIGFTKNEKASETD